MEDIAVVVQSSLTDYTHIYPICGDLKTIKRSLEGSLISPSI